MTTQHDPIKTAVRNNQVLVSCPSCYYSRMVPSEKFPRQKREVMIKCRCGHPFSLSLEYRQHPRKDTDLEGVFRLEAKEGACGLSVRVIDLSLGGVCLELEGDHQLNVGDKGTLQFKLDNAIQSSIMELVVISNISDQRVGCRFDNEKPFQKDLGFYLLG